MKKILLAGLLLPALCCAASAVEDAASAPAKQEPAREIKTPASAAPEADIRLTSSAVLAKLSEWDNKLETLKLSFSQTVAFGDTGIVNKITGSLLYMKPDKLRVEHLTPERQTVYTDRKVIWIYKPQDNQAVKTLWGDWLRQQSGTFAGITDFGAYGSLGAEHDVKISAPEKSKTVEAVFTPKKNPKSYTLTLVLSREDFFPSAVNIRLGSATVDTALSQVEKNAKIADGSFVFAPPSGAEVLDLTGGQ
ncbi:MAG: outer-membrane lipoprotein carrier protein LolA [Elusimicrobiales bacterium]|nr:outer-membrane lipoprotein carrier protein LolA [Elusimicrobiales bacterium]